MRRYRTEIDVPPDRTVLLHLPVDFPEGRAFVTVHVDPPEPEEGRDLDRHDIEWWDEFEGPDHD